MSRSIRFTGDANTGQGRFAIVESIGAYEAIKEPFDETIAITKQMDEDFVIPVSTTDFDIDLTGLGEVKKVYFYISVPVAVKFKDDAAPSVLLSGVNVVGGNVQHLFVTTTTASVIVRVVAGA